MPNFFCPVDYPIALSLPVLAGCCPVVPVCGSGTNPRQRWGRFARGCPRTTKEDGDLLDVS